jgi:hypothetical protein
MSSAIITARDAVTIRHCTVIVDESVAYSPVHTTSSHSCWIESGNADASILGTVA